MSRLLLGEGSPLQSSDMHVKSLTLKAFKRFHNLQIADLPGKGRLIVLAGPNGCGKSSVFDAFACWYGYHRDWGNYDRTYHEKRGLTAASWNDAVRVEFHEAMPQDPITRKKMFYIRSAYRNEAEFTLNSFSRSPSALDDGHRVRRLIDNDVHVSDNYQRLVSATVQAVFDPAKETKTVKELRDELIGEIRASMLRVFPDLLLSSTGNPLEDGSFFFTKGTSNNFHYKNLSGGEKAAFDLILDLVVKRPTYDATVFCIDEPDQHMSTRLQGALLQEIFELTPPGCQLWISTHSIGMLRKAKQLYQANPDNVVFLDFHDQDFDAVSVLRPQTPSRAFWLKVLNVALDDLAALVAPAIVVLCEGRPHVPSNPARAGLDAQCYQKIFAQEFPETDFLSVGNAGEVASDKLDAGRAIQTIVSGTKVIRVIDCDDRSPQEIADLQQDGVRVLTKRHLESYLMDDEVLRLVCDQNGKLAKFPEVQAAKHQAMVAIVAQGKQPDDVKSAAGLIYVETKKILELTQCGNTTEAFCRDTLAPLVRPGTQTYALLKQDIFGP